MENANINFLQVPLDLDHEWATFFFKGPGSENLRLCGPHNFYCHYSALPGKDKSSPIKGM